MEVKVHVETDRRIGEEGEDCGRSEVSVIQSCQRGGAFYKAGMISG